MPWEQPGCQKSRAYSSQHALGTTWLPEVPGLQLPACPGAHLPEGPGVPLPCSRALWGDTNPQPWPCRPHSHCPGLLEHRPRPWSPRGAGTRGREAPSNRERWVKAEGWPERDRRHPEGQEERGGAGQGWRKDRDWGGAGRGLERDRDRGAGGCPRDAGSAAGERDRERSGGAGRGTEAQTSTDRARGQDEQAVTLAVGGKAASVGLSFLPLPLSPPHPSRR